MCIRDSARAKRFFAPWGTAATADLVAVAALGARMYAPFDPAYADALMDAALRSYAVLAAHPTEVIPDLSAFSTGDYVGQFNGNPNHDRGVRIWALSELYESTGNATFLDELEAHLSFFDTPTAQCAGNRDPLSMCKVADLVEWNQQRDMGIVPYLLSARSPDLRNASLVAEVGEQLRLVVDKWARTASYDPFGRHMGDFTKFGVSVWGINGEAARHALLFETARRALGVDHTRVSAATLHHLLGRNEERRSWVLKLGFNPPENPHHRPSFVFKDTWPGLLVGGPFPGARAPRAVALAAACAERIHERRLRTSREQSGETSGGHLRRTRSRSTGRRRSCTRSARSRPRRARQRRARARGGKGEATATTHSRQERRRRPATTCAAACRGPAALCRACARAEACYPPKRPNRPGLRRARMHAIASRP